MQITVLFFASLRETLRCDREVMDLPATVGSVGALREALVARGGDWLALGPGRNVRAALNQELVGPQAELKAGDEVAFFPPVTGG